jgi:hypothetical protein
MLEEIQVVGVKVRPSSGRGRKTMGSVERSAVSERMKRYWEERRSEKTQEAVAD